MSAAAAATTSAKFAITRSMTVRSIVNFNGSVSAASSVLEPKILSAGTFKKNSYLVRKHSFKSYMTENIPKLMQNYSLI
jgi:hypothetical protein